MTKIFKHLAKHWAACLVIIALLLVQAYGDLTLPDYTSKIVDARPHQLCDCPPAFHHQGRRPDFSYAGW